MIRRWAYMEMGFPGGASAKEPACQCRRHKRCGFDPWLGRSPWRRPWQLTPVFLPGKLHGQRRLQATVHRVVRVKYNWSNFAHMLYRDRKIHSKFYYLSKEECYCVLRKAASVEIREKSLVNQHIKCWQECGATEILTRSSQESKSWHIYQWNTIQQFKE